MKGATQAGPGGTLPRVGYRLEMKAADWPDPAVPEDTVEDTSDPDAPKWAGDLYTSGDETDPVEAFAAFTGDDGVTAWLDASPDGLTGWVKDGEDVYRYTDPQSWQLDVDGAGMARAGELGDGAAEGEQPADELDTEAPVDGEEPPAEGEEPPVEGEPEEETDPDAPLEDGEDVQVDDADGHDPNGDTPKVPGDGVAPANEDEGAEPEHDENMDPEDDNFYTRMKKKGEKKSLAIRVSVAR